MKTNSISMAAHFLVVTCLSVVLIANIQADVLTDDWLSEVRIFIFKIY
jgi:hypothetical protein